MTTMMGPLTRREAVQRLGLLTAGSLVLPAFTRDLADVTRLAFGSCAKEYLAQPIWDAIGAAAPAAFVFLGDSVYGDTTDMAVLRGKFAKLDHIPEFARFRAKVPVIGTWDDHDFGANDVGSEYSKKVESQQVFLDFLRIPADHPRRSQEGVYDCIYFGEGERRVQVILLDMRYHRDRLISDGGNGYRPDNDPAKTFLGDVQWSWLRAQLAEPAAVRIIVSSIQVLSEEHKYEKWMNFPHEQARLFEAIKAAGAEGVVLISGDRHFGELARLDDAVGYPLYEMTTSSLTHTEPDSIREANRHRIGAAGVGVNNFGVVSVDWTNQRLSLELRDTDGSTVSSQGIALADLKSNI